MGVLFEEELGILCSQISNSNRLKLLQVKITESSVQGSDNEGEAGRFERD